MSEKQEYGFFERRYVENIIERIKTDNKMRACLSRADNPDTSYQSWEYLLRYGINIEDERELLRYSVVSAAIARGKPEKNGSVGIGMALVLSYGESESERKTATAKLRRLLACKKIQEVCSILPSYLRLVQSKSESELDYALLLADLRFFNNNIKAKWAKDFFRKSYEENKNDSVND
jgi:CRISPR system Cascade subunit CasB